MVVKYFEYSHKLAHGVGWGAACRPDEVFLASLPEAVRALPVPDRLGTFFAIYYLMTGLHLLGAVGNREFLVHVLPTGGGLVPVALDRAVSAALGSRPTPEDAQ